MDLDLESTLGLEPSSGRWKRIGVVALAFVVAALSGGASHNRNTNLLLPPSTTTSTSSSQHNMNVNATSSASNANKMSTTNNDDRYCFTKGSLHQLAIDTFYQFSPPNSKSYNKMKHVLDINPAFYIDMGGGRGIFTKNEEMIARMLRGYGLKQVPRPSSNASTNQTKVLFVETIFTQSPCSIGAEHCRNHPRILLQTEQYLKQEVGLCHQSPNCVIMDFSDFNLEKAGNAQRESFVILPIMTQNPSRMAQYEPTEPKDLQQRSIDMSFFGEMTNRRNGLREGAATYREAHPDRKTAIKKLHNLQGVANHYKETKVCLLMHSYSTRSGGEFHRVSEFAPFGCIPVMERFMDTFGMNVYDRCANAFFEEWQNLTIRAAEVVANIDNGLYVGREHQLKHWWKTGVHWERLLPTLYSK